MTTAQTLVLALALSMDAFAVSVCRGSRQRSSLVTASTFGAFQAVMPVLGWMAGSFLREILHRAAPWAAFLILAAVGIRMVWNTFRPGRDACSTTGDGWLPLLAFATSLDAFAAGISLSLLGYPVLMPAAIIGGVTFGVCLAGSRLGAVAGRKLGRGLEFAGGILLIFLGLRALLQG